MRPARNKATRRTTSPISSQQQRRLHFLFDSPGDLKASSLKEPCFDLLYEAFSLSLVKDLIAYPTTSPLYPILPRPILQPQCGAPHSLIECRLRSLRRDIGRIVCQLRSGVCSFTMWLRSMPQSAILEPHQFAHILHLVAARLEWIDVNVDTRFWTPSKTTTIIVAQILAVHVVQMRGWSHRPVQTPSIGISQLCEKWWANIYFWT